MMSHKHLLHHIKKAHSIHWEDYFIKYFFKGKYPTCSCGCGEKVKLLRNGKNDKGEVAYARQMLSGHNANRPGYRKNTKVQKEKMRKSAIKRMQSKKGAFFTKGKSKQEKELGKFLKTVVSKIIPSDKELLSGLEIDYFLPEHKIAIEYNGGYWHSDVFKEKRYHLKKTKEVEEKGSRLIHIWDHDWVHKRKVVESIITNALGKNKERIYARKTELREINNKDTTEFLKSNHLQGSSVSKYRYGLFNNGELVSVMTFSSLRRATGLEGKEGSYELIRFCNKINTSVVGGASKLYNHFIKEVCPKMVLSYANRDWATGDLYEKLGFTFKGYTEPGYFYTKSKYKFSRYNFQKHKLVREGADPSLTEYQIMLNDGYFRVWDTGNLKYIWEVS